MDDIKFRNLAAPLRYFPIQIGKAELKKKYDDLFILNYDGLQWCSFNPVCNIEIKEQFIEINLAKGKVVTTGLGFGLLQTILAQKKEVEQVIVYEKNLDIIKMFEFFAEKSGFNTDKIKIINQDANSIVDVECDWFIMDHYEAVHQPFWEILDNVREIAKKNKAKNYWFWPICHMYLVFCDMKKLKFNQTTFAQFAKQLKIDNLPIHMSESIISKFQLLHQIKFS